MTSRGGITGGGRERSQRLDDRNSAGQSQVPPPSRHLWVGNLPHNISETEIIRQFSRFGELDTVAHQPGRSYAFINFRDEEGAIDALKTLQGFPLAGNPLRIEFAKEKTFQSHNDAYLERHEEHFTSSRGRQASPDSLHPDRAKINDINEPSEVLWIGFPAMLKVDEPILRKAFSPFGEIERITTFAGRTYAFVQFRNVVSAIRAKETLQGKLFGNPRVHICFSKNEAGSSRGARGSTDANLSPHYKSSSHQVDPDNLWLDRDINNLAGNPAVRSPQFIPSLDSEVYDSYDLNRKRKLRLDGNDLIDSRRFPEDAPELRLSRNAYELHPSPARERIANYSYSSQGFSREDSLYEEPWDLPEENAFLGGKRLKTNAFPDKELPEFPLSDIRHGQKALQSVYSDIVPSDHFDKNFESADVGYQQMHGRLMHVAGTRGERNWPASYNDIRQGSAMLPSLPVDNKRMPDLKVSSVKDWKWEGMIAKGGSPICRARCFPVGKVLDIMLPEILDCTARTGLDMLAKHYYQAAGAWVVFFVADDTDIEYYNEFMHYLEEKQRAAVAKLDERNTLFLVPPSDFSENVLKVPGKLSISGVVLRLEPTGPTLPPEEIRLPNMTVLGGGGMYQKQSAISMFEAGKHGLGNVAFPSNSASFLPPTQSTVNAVGTKYLYGDGGRENVHEYKSHPQAHLLGMNQPPTYTESSVSYLRNISAPVDSGINISQMLGQATAVPSHDNYGSSGLPPSHNNNLPLLESKSSVELSRPLDLNPAQLAQLATLFGQQRQSGNLPNVSAVDGYSQRNMMIPSQNPAREPDSGPFQHVKMTTTELSMPQFSSIQPLQQQKQQQQKLNLPGPPLPPPPPLASREVQNGAQGSQQSATAGSSTAEAESDPQKRLQATLQLAAALLQQIQQGKGP